MLYALAPDFTLVYSVHREKSLRLIEPLILIFYATLPMLSCSLIYMFVIVFNFEWKMVMVSYLKSIELAKAIVSLAFQ